eukprot:ANDGO_04826.mRNA.1 hypothetical protein
MALKSSIFFIILGYILGRFKIPEFATHVFETIPLQAKFQLGLSLTVIFVLYFFLILIPLDRLAVQESKRTSSFPSAEVTSFRVQLLRRGSF